MRGSPAHQPAERRRRPTEGTPGDVQPATDLPDEPVASTRRRRAVTAGHRADAEEAMALLDALEPEVRASAVGALSRMGLFTAELAQRAAADESADVRRRACEEMGRQLGRVDQEQSPGVFTESEILAVLTTAMEDEDDSVVEAACWAAGEAGTGAMLLTTRLAEVATSHRAALCRESAVAALGAIGDPGSLSAVLGALDDRPAIRRRAALSLAAFSGPQVEDGLRRCLDDRDWQVRQIAEDLLGR